MNGVVVELNIPFPSKREADVVYQTIKVDLEPLKSKKIIEGFYLSSNILKVLFYAEEARKVRVAVTSFFESLLLVTETMKEFGPPAATFDHYGSLDQEHTSKSARE